MDFFVQFDPIYTYTRDSYVIIRHSLHILHV